MSRKVVLSVVILLWTTYLAYVGEVGTAIAMVFSTAIASYNFANVWSCESSIANAWRSRKYVITQLVVNISAILALNKMMNDDVGLVMSALIGSYNLANAWKHRSEHADHNT